MSVPGLVLGSFSAKEAAERSALPCQDCRHSCNSLMTTAWTPGCNSATQVSHSHLASCTHRCARTGQCFRGTQEDKQGGPHIPGAVLSGEADFQSLFWEVTQWLMSWPTHTQILSHL